MLGTEQISTVFLMFAVILLAATASNIVERFGQPPVVGQLAAGVGLAILGYVGWELMRDAAHNSILAFLANFGAMVLLLTAGLESKIQNLARNGLYATAVALIGVVIPFLSGVLLGPIFFPGQKTQTFLFLGAALVATSVGIAVAIFRALGAMRTRAAQTVLAAAVFDDILGLVILAVISQLAVSGHLSAGTTAFLVVKAVAFLFGALALGRVLAPTVSRGFGKLNNEASTKLVLAITLALILGFLAHAAGMQPIIGAFAAGLLLEGLDFEEYDESEVVTDLQRLRSVSASIDRPKINRLIGKHRRNHLGGMVDILGAISVPVFFVYTGLQVTVGSLLEPRVYLAALGIAGVAILGKILAGLASKGTLHERLIVGVAMVPRGEVGLIFASTARSLGIFDNIVYSSVVLAIILTTFVAPPLLTRLLATPAASGR